MIFMPGLRNASNDLVEKTNDRSESKIRDISQKLLGCASLSAKADTVPKMQSIFGKPSDRDVHVLMQVFSQIREEETLDVTSFCDPFDSITLIL